MKCQFCHLPSIDVFIENFFLPFLNHKLITEFVLYCTALQLNIFAHDDNAEFVLDRSRANRDL